MKWRICRICDFCESDYQKAFLALSDSRKARISRMLPEDKKRSLAGEMLARQILREDFSIESNLESDESGRPYVQGREIFVSISHSKSLVASVVSETPIGIDAEKIKPVDLKLAKRVCTENELNFLFGKTPDDTDFIMSEEPDILSRFFEIWTAKEAYFKKIGTGITNFKSIDILSLNRKIIQHDDYFIQIVY